MRFRHAEFQRNQSKASIPAVFHNTHPPLSYCKEQPDSKNKTNAIENSSVNLQRLDVIHTEALSSMVVWFRFSFCIKWTELITGDTFSWRTTCNCLWCYLILSRNNWKPSNYQDFCGRPSSVGHIEHQTATSDKNPSIDALHCLLSIINHQPHMDSVLYFWTNHNILRQWFLAKNKKW